jgi:hypothetical protein
MMLNCIQNNPKQSFRSSGIWFWVTKWVVVPDVAQEPSAFIFLHFQESNTPWKWRNYIPHRNNAVRTSNHTTSNQIKPPTIFHNTLQKLIILLYAWTLQMIASTCNKEHAKLHLPVHNQMEAFNTNISKMQSIPAVHRVPAVFFPVRHYE